MFEHSQKKGSVVHYSEPTDISNAELLELPCDVLVPAAIASQITRSNAGISIRVKTII